MFYRKKRPIIVDGVRYSYAGEAAEKLGKEFTHSGLAYAARHGHNYKGHSVMYASDHVKVQKEQAVKQANFERRYPKACKVICSDGTVYNSIEQASKAAGVSGWTMGVKMETAGSFVDKNGNSYTRERPMETKNVYRNTGNYMKKPRQVKSTTVYTKPIVENIQPITETPAANNTNAADAKQVLKEQSIKFIQQNDYNTAKVLLDIIDKL